MRLRSDPDKWSFLVFERVDAEVVVEADGGVHETEGEIASGQELGGILLGVAESRLAVYCPGDGRSSFGDLQVVGLRGVFVGGVGSGREEFSVGATAKVGGGTGGD